MTTRQISETIEDIYGFEVSDGMVSDITDRLLPQIEEWQNRPLDEVYPIVFIDAVHFSVRDNGQIKKLAAYVILAVSLTGHKEVLSIHIGENESAKYWPGVLNELKNRGVKDILVICADGLSGMKEAIAAWTCNSKMGEGLSECNEKPAYKPGCYLTDIQVFGTGQKGHIHHQCH